MVETKASSKNHSAIVEWLDLSVKKSVDDWEHCEMEDVKRKAGTLPFTKSERIELAWLMRFWVLNPRQEPLASQVAVYIKKICDIAVSKFYKDCPFDEREDLAMEMFRLMWKGLPKSYDPARCPKEVNFIWLLMRCKMYADGIWSRGYGSLGCPFTKARKAIKAMEKDYKREMTIIDELLRPDAYQHKVCNVNMDK